MYVLNFMYVFIIPTIAFSFVNAVHKQCCLALARARIPEQGLKLESRQGLEPQPGLGIQPGQGLGPESWPGLGLEPVQGLARKRARARVMAHMHNIFLVRGSTSMAFNREKLERYLTGFFSA